LKSETDLSRRGRGTKGKGDREGRANDCGGSSKGNVKMGALQRYSQSGAKKSGMNGGRKVEKEERKRESGTIKGKSSTNELGQA